MKSVLVIPSFGLLALIASGCMISPGNGDRLASPDAVVDFKGFTPYQDAAVQLQAAPSPNGPWTTFAASGPLSFAGNSWLDPQKPSTSRDPLYHWLVPNNGAAIPRINWHNTSANECEVFVQANDTTRSFLYYTFDNRGTSPKHENWSDCFARVQKAHGGSVAMATQVLECQSPTSPVVRLTAPSNGHDCACPTFTIFQGSTVVNSAATAEALRCATEVTGSLTVQSVDGLNVYLAHLQRVTGDMTLSYAPGTNNVVPSMQFPALVTIGGALQVQIVRMPSGGSAQLNLPALQNVNRGIQLYGMSHMTGMVTIAGLPKVTTLPSLSFRLDGDATLTSLLPALTKVTGDVSLQSSGAIHDTLAALARVDGDLSLVYNAGTSRPAESIGLQALTFIGKSLHLENTPWPSLAPAFAQLATVQGAVELFATNLTAIDLGASKLSVGSLNLNGNWALSALTPTRMSVAGSGDITIQNNTQLPPCAATNFVQLQTAGGWTGSANTDDFCVN